MELIAGQDVALDTNAVNLRLDRPAQAQVDMVALLLDDRGQVNADDDFVFYNAPRHPSGGATLAEPVPSLDLRVLPMGVERIVVTASSDGMDQLNHLRVSVEGDEQLTFAPSNLAGLPTAWHQCLGLG